MARRPAWHSTLFSKLMSTWSVTFPKQERLETMIQLKPICKMIRSDSQIDSFTKDVKLASFLNSPTPYRQISHEKNWCKTRKFRKKDHNTCSFHPAYKPFRFIDKSNHWRCSIKKTVLKNLAIFTGKNLCWSLVLIKLRALWKNWYVSRPYADHCNEIAKL